MIRKNNLRIGCFTLLLLLLTLRLAAEPVKVTGGIADEKGEALMGAIIVSKPSADGPVRNTSAADEKGRFSIECEPGDVLVAYFMGYDDAVVPVPKKGGHIDIVMQPNSTTVLNEVVVVGYGSVNKSDLTGSVTNVNMGDLRSAAVTSVDQAMQGRVAGADIMSTSGDPDATTSIRVRGTRSISASNDPLIVVDGVLDAVSDLNDINPADIESISILKDASSTAIYGARGSNGVILITTKEAQAGSSVSVTAKLTGGVSMLPAKLDVMNATQFSNYLNEYAQINTSTYSSITTETPISEARIKDPLAYGAGTDWVGAITRVAPYHSEQISASGTIGSAKYYASFNHYDNRGIIKNSGVRNMVARVNASADLFKWLNLGVKVNYTYRNTDDNLAQIGGTNIYHSAIYLSPLIPTDAITNPLNKSGAKVTMPTYQISENISNTIRSILTLVGHADVKIGKRVKLHTQISYYRFDRNKYAYNPSTLPTRMDGLGGKATRYYYAEEKINWDLTLNWKRKFAQKHSVDVMGGSALYNYVNDNLGLSGQGYLVDEMTWRDMDAVQDKNTYVASSGDAKKRTLSFFARVNYNFDKRYYLTLTARADGASNFAANNKWGFFPSAALRWNIQNESFMKAATDVDELSLKLSYGRSGNDAISTYRSLASLTSVTTGYLFSGVQPVAYYPNRLASPDLRWEKTDLVNLALTGSFFNNRISFTAEAYYAYTSDLLLDVQVANQTGYSSRLTNIGATSNKGLELSIESRNIVTSDFVWTTAFTISHNTQMVESIGGENYIIAYSAPAGYMMYGYVKGYPLNALWGFQYAGVWHNKEEVERNKMTKAVAARNGYTALGTPIYVDRNHDGVLDSEDITYLGNADPVVYGGLQNTFRIGKFSLGVYFVYSLGGKIFNFSELYMSGSRRTNQYAYMVNAWHPVKNPDSNLPAAGILDEADLHSTRQLHDASYLRLKTVSLSYAWNLKKKWVRDITFSISGENLWLWKNYNGFDPDVSTSSEGSTIRRMDLGAYPRARTIMASIQFRY